MMASPKISTVLLPTLAPILSLQAGLGIQSWRAIASEKAGLLRPSGPGKHCNHDEDSLSLLAQALTGFKVVLSILDNASFITAPLISSLC